MSRDKSIVIGVVILAGLSGLVWMQAKKDSALGSVEKAQADLPEIKGPDDVDKLTITNGAKQDASGEVTLEKKGDTWRVTKPVDAPASQANVKSLLDNLKELKVKETIASNADEALKKEYALDPAHAVHVVAWKGADKKVDDLFGKSGGRGQIVAVGDKPGVYAATGYSSYLYARDLKDWREREIFKFDDANVTALQITNPKATLSFTKGGSGDKWTGTSKGQPIAELDETKVQEAIRALKYANAEDFADGKSDADTGLDKPEAKMSVTLKDGAGNLGIALGKSSSGASHFARKDGGETTFVASSTLSDWALAADATKFQKPKDAGAPKAAPTPPAGMAPGMGLPPGMGMPPGHPAVPHE